MTKKEVAKTTNAVPAYLQDYANNKADAESLASASISVPRISLRGRKFRLILDGEEIRKPSDTLDVVVLAVEPGPNLFTKTFYINGYTTGDSSPPDCASSNGITPDGWVAYPQNAKCATCKQNIFGSATSTNGKKSKACRDSKRLWVALPDDIDGPVYALSVPVTSLKALAEYGKNVMRQGFPLPAIITSLEMEDSEFPKLLFSNGGFLEENEGRQAIERNIARDWDIGAASSGPVLEDHSGGKTGALPSVAEATSNKPVAGVIIDAVPATPTEGEADSAVGSW